MIYIKNRENLVFVLFGNFFMNFNNKNNLNQNHDTYKI